LGADIKSKIKMQNAKCKMTMQDSKIRKLKGANMDIDLISDKKDIHWEQDKCPWNMRENTNEHKCAVKNISICKYFKGIEYPDIVVCGYKK
jgi:hypothetical protein